MIYAGFLSSFGLALEDGHIPFLGFIRGLYYRGLYIVAEISVPDIPNINIVTYFKYTSNIIMCKCVDICVFQVVYELQSTLRSARPYSGWA